MEKERSQESGFSGIGVTAILAVALLVISVLWQSNVQLRSQSTHLTYQARSATTAQENDDQSSDDLNSSLDDLVIGDASGSGSTSSSSEVGATVIDRLITTYATLKQQGEYTPERGAMLGSMIAPMIRADISYKKFTTHDIKTTADLSHDGALKYRDALHEALAPLRKNDAPEFEFFGKYIETKDPIYLAQMRNVATLYYDAAGNAASVVVPADVASYHAGILNALGEFSSTLNALADHADDPIESTILLKNYNTAERDVLDAFNALGHYYAKKNS